MAQGAVRTAAAVAVAAAVVVAVAAVEVLWMSLHDLQESRVDDVRHEQSSIYDVQCTTLYISSTIFPARTG